MALSPVRQNPCCEVHFAGWRSDTYTLHHRGWHIAIKEQDYRGNLVMLLHHKELRMSGLAEARDFIKSNYMVGSRTMNEAAPVFVVKHLASELIVNHQMVEGLRWIDPTPSTVMMDLHGVNLHSLPLFTELGKPNAEELIVDPADVSMLLDQIKKMQAPGQKQIRENDRRRERQIHASITSFMEAA